jgi:hypothetical protein
MVGGATYTEEEKILPKISETLGRPATCRKCGKAKDFVDGSVRTSGGSTDVGRCEELTVPTVGLPNSHLLVSAAHSYTNGGQWHDDYKRNGGCRKTLACTILICIKMPHLLKKQKAEWQQNVNNLSSSFGR